mmetsp:Transcript_42946/g.84695  ORF Transcript_42946/g.84695 Transcript_42946/m.84695 type:complete len:84 (+) Transcript_42946:186-437(+)
MQHETLSMDPRSTECPTVLELLGEVASAVFCRSLLDESAGIVLQHIRFKTFVAVVSRTSNKLSRSRMVVVMCAKEAAGKSPAE